VNTSDGGEASTVLAETVLADTARPLIVACSSSVLM
jgi:hypothetical protein